MNLSPEVALAAAVSLLSVAAVWIPLQRGLAIVLRALRATRRISASELRRGLQAEQSGGGEPISLLLLRVLEKSLQENESAGHPTEFVRDASKQYVMNEYDASFAQPISMFANILPPIGFIGTTLGLMVLFLSMHLSNEALQIGGLAFALSSTLFALVGFALLEGLKIKLYGRLLRSLDAALFLPAAPDDAALSSPAMTSCA